jgi:TetR/AcrR family transcriptional regulator
MEIKNNQSMESIILETAEKLFLEKGFAMTSTTEIAKEVGCNQALVHYYFRTKENLFNVIFEQKFKEFFQGIFQIKIQDLPFLEKLRFIIESHFDLLVKSPRIPLLILNELSRQPEQINILREKLHVLPEQLFKELSLELKAEIDAGKIRQISIVDLFVTLISLNVALFIMMPVAEKVIPLDGTQKQMMIAHRRSENVDFILKSLRP